MIDQVTFNLWKNYPITGFYYEMLIVIILGIFIMLIYRRYLEKGRPALTKLVFQLFLFYFIGWQFYLVGLKKPSRQYFFPSFYLFYNP